MHLHVRLAESPRLLLVRPPTIPLFLSFALDRITLAVEDFLTYSLTTLPNFLGLYNGFES